ncbi:DUF1631 family protein [Rhodoferax sp. 4810]|uniref:DUF1631 family protein n=1 Tax=Thiospirillum jenense TaxID=1653858 RepID=A0A839HCA2_9GAMM|nr:DUF1631 family protein [Thiospirillum jenense]MBB1073170.1 DUF1631 family protein [Rhodoferax jenense]MBB1124669.1 DUF1631 family protein [Thiospirillum jenense]
MPKPSQRDPELLKRYTQVMQQYGNCVATFCQPSFAQVFERVEPTLLTIAVHIGDAPAIPRVTTLVATLNGQRAAMLARIDAELTNKLAQFCIRARLTPPPAEITATAPPSVTEPVTSDPAPLAAEEMLATENLIITANAGCFPELYALSQRLAMINHGRKLKDADIPGGPRQLVGSFQLALAPLALDAGVKIILYALLQKYVTNHAAVLYAELNNLLRNTGILQRTHPINLRHRRSGKTAPLPAITPASANHDLFASILELVTVRRGAVAAAAPPTSHLLTALSAATPLDVRLRALLLGVTPPPAGAATETDLSTRVEMETVAVRRSTSRFSLDTAHAVVDSVGTWFEDMLATPLLPAVVKAQLSCLHTLYLTLALRDQTLLTNHRHPARQLLSDLIEAGSLWVDESNLTHGIFPTVQKIVDRLLQTAEADVALFDHLGSKLRRQMTEQRRPSERLEPRAAQLVRGHLPSRHAQQRASQVLHLLTAHHALPDVIRQFLDSTWQDLLTYILLRQDEGPDSAAWHEAVATATQLVELFDPQLSPSELQQRIQALPRLRQRIFNGITRLGSHNHAVFTTANALLGNPRALRERVRQYQSAAANRVMPAAVVSPDAFDATQLQQGLKELPPTELLTLDAPAPPPLTNGATASSTVNTVHQSNQTFAVQAMIEQLRETPLGTWFEIDWPNEAGDRQRLRLTWISPLTTACTFVNQSGNQAALRNLGELAQAILSGRGRVLTEDSSTTTWHGDDD